MRKKIMLMISALIVFLALAQWIPVRRTNPPVETEVSAPAEVKSILKRACYDCHSNDTVWPWYSRVAPVSWMVAWDVHRGRNEFNFSTWNRLDNKHQAEKIKGCWKEVSEDEMPLLVYRLAHPEARLSPEDKEILHQWALSQDP